MFLKYILIFLFFPVVGFSFVFQFQADAQKNYRLFSASVQNIEQKNLGLSHASFEQAYEGFLRTKKVENNVALLEGEYHYSQRPFKSQEAFILLGKDKVYKSLFNRKPNGKIEALNILDFYPSVRSIPTFPARNVIIGDTWTDIGEEVQDFSIIGYPIPFKIPFQSEYQYITDINITEKELENIIQQYKNYQFTVSLEVDKYMQRNREVNTIEAKKNIAIIHVRYEVAYSDNTNIEQTQKILKYTKDPVIKATGGYNGIVFWNKDAQEQILSIGEYDFTYLWNSKQERRWSGKEYGLVTVLVPNKESLTQLVKQVAKNDKSIEVLEEDKGVKLILGDLLFQFNKTSLRPQVEKTLERILSILQKNPHSAIHITGHSDDIGHQRVKENIAQGRASSVAKYLIENGIADSRITYSGSSDREPRFPNTSAENRKKNRRVELDIITQ